MATTRYYLTNATAAYTPATLRGAWDDTASAVTKALQAMRAYGGVTTTVARAETNAAANFDVLLYRGIGPPLGAQTLAGTVTLCLGVLESSASADFAYHLHLYVTQGDSDTPRGTLLTDYVETTANEWPTTIAGHALAAGQAIASLAVTAGDRIVVEVGYVALNASASSFTGTLRYGTQVSTNTDMTADLTAADTAVTTHAPWIEFDSTIAEQAAGSNIKVTQAGVYAVDRGGKVKLTQLGVQAVTTHEVNARLTSFGVYAVIYTDDEVDFDPGGSFGPIVWAEIESTDGTTHVVASLDLPDPATYYHGYKIGKVITPPTIVRALSDENGEYESQSFALEMDDTARYFRDLLADAETQLIYNKRVVVRMIDEAAWRRREIPRTVAIGLVRNYEAT